MSMEVGYGRMSQREIVLIAKTILSVRKKSMAFSFLALHLGLFFNSHWSCRYDNV
jgi:hypothetical protein